MLRGLGVVHEVIGLNLIAIIVLKKIGKALMVPPLSYKINKLKYNISNIFISYFSSSIES